MKQLRYLIFAASLLLMPLYALAQNSLPAPGGRPGRGGGSLPAPGGVAPSRSLGGGWGNPWNQGWNPPPAFPPDWQDSGTATVMACGYDAQGVWRVLPLKVYYNYNGMQYDVTVVNAWNPWSYMWNYGVDMPAYNTSYFINGNTYDFYAPLSTGTYYFNL